MLPHKTEPAKHVFDDIYDLPEFWTDDKHFRRAKDVIVLLGKVVTFSGWFLALTLVFATVPASLKQHVHPYVDVFGIIDAIEGDVSAAIAMPSLLIVLAIWCGAILLTVSLVVRLLAIPWAKRRFKNLTGGHFELAGSGRVTRDARRLREIGYFDAQGAYVGLTEDEEAGTMRYLRAPHNVHVLITGPSGAGKTSAYILPLLLSAEPVGETAATTREPAGLVL